MNTLFDPRSIATPGAMYYVKEYLGHRAVKKEVMQNFQHVWDLLQVKYVTYPIFKYSRPQFTHGIT